MSSRVSISSDGSLVGTHVTVDGAALDRMVTAVHWSASAGVAPTAQVNLALIPVEVDGNLRSMTLPDGRRVARIILDDGTELVASDPADGEPRVPRRGGW